MPKIPIDYKKTVIYKIVCNDLSVTDCYVGHTTDFVRRKCGHKKRCTNETNDRYNLKIYKMIRQNGGWESFTMVEIEKFPCQDVFEATARERYYYEQLNSTMNSHNPHRSRVEYCEINRDKMMAKKKEWVLCNKEEISVKNKLNYLVNKVKIDAQRNEYCKMNRDKVLAQKKKYCEIHKEQIKEKRMEKIICECGREINFAHILRHLKTKVHNDLMLLKNVTSV
jgi:hypothetical protein